MLEDLNCVSGRLCLAGPEDRPGIWGPDRSCGEALWFWADPSLGWWRKCKLLSIVIIADLLGWKAALLLADLHMSCCITHFSFHINTRHVTLELIINLKFFGVCFCVCFLLHWILESAFLLGTLDLSPKCHEHQADAPHFHPRGGGHDSTGGSEWGRNPPEPSHPLQRTSYLCKSCCPFVVLKAYFLYD